MTDTRTERLVALDAAADADWRTGAIAYLRAAAEDRARAYAHVPDMLRGADIIERLANDLEIMQQASPYGLDCAPPPAPEQPALSDAQPQLTVRLQSFPESNGKRNWTAMFIRKVPWSGLIGNCGGITIARGELWNRVAYEAECAKVLIGERDTEPHILDYGDDIKTPDEWAGETHGGRALKGQP